MTDHTFFAILFVGRQGSSYLQALLDSHPDATCEGELFSPTARLIADLVRRRTISFRNSRQKDVASYLEKMLHKKGSRVTGFKMPYLSLLEHTDAVEAFKRFGYKIVRLSRDNLLDQYISYRLAALNNSWRSDYGPTKINDFYADPNDVLTAFEKWTSDNSALHRIASEFPNLHVTYEQLVDGSGVLRCLEFLNLRDAPLESRFKRQRTGAQSEIISNYDELKGHFIQTEWARHFLD